MATDIVKVPNNSSTRVVGTGGVLAGRVVERASDLSVVLASNNAVFVDGVALNDEVAGNNVDVWRGAEMRVYFSATAVPNQRILCTGSGQVGPAGATPDARMVIGHALENVPAPGLYRAYIRYS